MSAVLGDLRTMFESEARKASAKSNPQLMEWAKKYLPHHCYEDPSTFHIELASSLRDLSTGKGERLMRMAPRGFAKSTWVSGIFPLFCICHGMKDFVLLISDTEDQAKHFLETIKHELTENSALKRDYPNACGKGSLWSVGQITTSNGVRVEALGTGQKVRGRKYINKRPDLVICDDLQNDDDIYSPATLERQWSWFLKGVLMCGGDDCVFLLVGTNLHEKCIVSRAYSLPGWDTGTYRAIESWPVNMHLWEAWEGVLNDISASRTERDENAMAFYKERKSEMDEGAVVLWPEKRNLYQLMLERASDHDAFESERQNNPRVGKRYAFQPEFFHGDIWYEERALDSLRGKSVTVIAVDPAKGNELKKNDYSAWVALTLHGHELYVEPTIERKPVDLMLEDVMNYAKGRNVHVISFEENTFQYLVADIFERKTLDQNFIVGISLINNQINKNIRIQRLGPFLSRKRFRFKKSCPYTNILLEQLRNFPYADHDDGPDVLEMSLRTLINALDNSRKEPNSIENLDQMQITA